MGDGRRAGDGEMGTYTQTRREGECEGETGNVNAKREGKREMGNRTGNGKRETSNGEERSETMGKETKKEK